MMTLDDMKTAILNDRSWTTCTGADDYDGYVDDCGTSHAVRCSRSWDDLAESAPPSWLDAVLNKCLPSQV